MRRWIAEGRVTGDSWVWRDGWSDWRSAGEMLRGVRCWANVAADAELAPAGGLPEIVVKDQMSAIRTEGRTVVPRRSMTKTIVLVAALGAISIALLGGLIQVVLSSGG
jgi:hypothetical protein